ncbi:9530_t:CDS:2 [Gigaspora margarita]|uniref:9530_t:CDS:1 n=1 Tax=Gigaspora margarita TaxID=4874 RepID=A0ABN7UP73_GIGMA|nr:9530_t:CDS:2 [Gigaspora margarita]
MRSKLLNVHQNVTNKFEEVDPENAKDNNIDDAENVEDKNVDNVKDYQLKTEESVQDN